MRCNVLQSYLSLEAYDHFDACASCPDTCLSGRLLAAEELLCQRELCIHACVAQQVQGRQASYDQEARQRAADDMAKRMPSKRLALALIKRGWQIGRPQLHIGICTVSCCGHLPLHLAARRQFALPACSEIQARVNIAMRDCIHLAVPSAGHVLRRAPCPALQSIMRQHPSILSFLSLFKIKR